METLSLARGAGGSWTITIRDGDGAPITTYAGTEPLSGRVWRGGDAAPAFTVAPTWADPSAGTVTLTIPKADTADLDPGQYRIQCTITDGITDPVFFEAILSITDAPGTATAGPVYCTLADMLDECSWLQDVSDIEHDETGFLKQRVRARQQWLHPAILAAHRPQQGWGATTFGNSLFGVSQVRTPAINKILADYLAADKLMVDPPRIVTPMCAKYAVGLVLKDQITSGGGGPRGNPYAALSAQFLAEASAMLAGYVAEVDINDDGYPEYVIPCGTIDVLRA